MCMHERACACMSVHVDDCFNHSLCSSSLYGLYVMVFHRVSSEGGVLVYVQRCSSISMIRSSINDDMVSNEVEVSGFGRDACIPFTQRGFM